MLPFFIQTRTVKFKSFKVNVGMERSGEKTMQKHLGKFNLGTQFLVSRFLDLVFVWVGRDNGVKKPIILKSTCRLFLCICYFSKTDFFDLVLT